MYERDIQETIAYLRSSNAHAALQQDAYWPKWDGPWWRMLLLHEMGLNQEIPESVTGELVAALNRIPLKSFPIHPGDLPEGVDPFRGTPCHCQLGNVYQVLAARGVDVDHEVPWIRPWFLRYQMADGGLNCDNDAYLINDECPSSMVGTIAVFEAVVRYTPRTFTPEESVFVQKGADFLIKRKLIDGSNTKHNANERESAKQWFELCFPRFYLYDVMRGLDALLSWSEKTQNVIPREIMQQVTNAFEISYPDGQVKIGRRSYAGAGTIAQNENGEWIRRQPARMHSLLERVSQPGEISPFLTLQWAKLKARLAKQPMA